MTVDPKIIQKAQTTHGKATGILFTKLIYSSLYFYTLRQVLYDFIPHYIILLFAVLC